jgi:molybdenum cofactor guanylyltransferase
MLLGGGGSARALGPSLNVTAVGPPFYIFPMSGREPVAAILLAGGGSSRMGGGDKCLRMLGGRPILARIIERLNPQVSDMVLSANGDASRFARFGLPIVADRIPDLAGPLAGIHAGLEWVKANRPGIRYALTVATDTPFIPGDLVKRFLAAVEGPAALVVARSEGGVHPVIGLWPVELAGALEVSLKDGARKVGAWTETHGRIEVLFPQVALGGGKIDPFFNINEPDQLAEANALLAQMAP